MDLTAKEWITLVGIPLVVSLAANVLTPLVQRILRSGSTAATKGANNAADKLLKVRVSQIDAEIREIERLRDNPEEVIKLLEGSVIFSQMSLWALLLSPIAAVLFSKLSPYLPWLYSNPTFTAASLIAAVAAAGPLQATIYASIVQRKLKKVRDSSNRLDQLNAEKKRVLALLGVKPAADSSQAIQQ
jgi:hypothetical protein